MLSFIVQNDIILKVIMLGVAMVNIIILSDVIPCVTLQSVIILYAPIQNDVFLHSHAKYVILP